MRLIDEERLQKEAVCRTLEKLLNQTHKARTNYERYEVKYDKVLEKVIVRVNQFEKVLEVNVMADSVSALAEDVLKAILEKRLLYKEGYFYE